jgi:hypothetical protein
MFALFLRLHLRRLRLDFLDPPVNDDVFTPDGHIAGAAARCSWWPGNRSFHLSIFSHASSGNKDGYGVSGTKSVQTFMSLTPDCIRCRFLFSSALKHKENHVLTFR